MPIDTRPTLYDILGVSRSASPQEIRAAWRDAADRFAPGEGGSTQQFRLFNEAAEVLLDPERRREYDAELGESSSADPVPDPPVPGTAGTAALATATPGTARDTTTDTTTDTTSDTTSDATPDATTDATTGGTVGAAGAGEPGGGRPRLRRAGRLAGAPFRAVVSVLGVPLAVAVALLVAVAIGLAAYFVSEAEQAEAHQAALDRAPAAAENAALAVLSYDHETLEADRDAAAKFLSEDYRSDYVDTFDKLVAKSATESKATVEAEVLASSAMTTGSSESDDRVPVLLFVNQTTTSATTDQPTVALNRVRFDMVQEDGTWRVDGITSY